MQYVFQHSEYLSLFFNVARKRFKKKKPSGECLAQEGHLVLVESVYSCVEV